MTDREMELLEETQEEEKEELSREEKRGRRRARARRAGVVIDRIFGFFLAVGILFGVAGLGVEYILIDGPSPALRETFVMTMLETRRFRWIPNIFLSTEQLKQYTTRDVQTVDTVSDPSLIQIHGQDTQIGSLAGEKEESDSYGLVDEDGDGIIIDEVKGRGFSGKMMIVLDPSRCFIGDGGGGLTINSIAEKYGATGGINGGAFFDPSGGGSGGQPEGLTIYDGVVRHNPGYACSIAGFNSDHVLFVGWFTYEDCVANDIVSCVSFSPPLIINGVPNENLVSSVNPRTSIGQRADGAVLMLVIDGRQASGMGATYADMRDVMLQYGAVNACNLDGGSSSVMYYQGEIINMPSSASGASRWLPNAFLFK